MQLPTIFLIIMTYALDANIPSPRIKNFSYRTLFRSQNEITFDTKEKNRILRVLA